MSDVPVAMDAPAPRDVAADARGATCGTRGTGPCPAGYFCDHPIDAMCGVADQPGACAPVPQVCPDVHRPVCGCDGRTYGNDCEAAAASVSVRASGACPVTDAGTATDVGADVASQCAAQDAVGVGACARFLGYAWSGASCAGVSGCSCSGSACASLYDSIEACRAAYERCDCRALGCGAGRNCQACLGPGRVVYVCIPDGAAC